MSKQACVYIITSMVNIVYTIYPINTTCKHAVVALLVNLTNRH